MSKGFSPEDKIIELGTAIQNSSLQHTNDEQITVVDLTGVAVQDIMITKPFTLFTNKRITLND